MAGEARGLHERAFGIRIGTCTSEEHEETICRRNLVYLERLQVLVSPSVTDVPRSKQNNFSWIENSKHTFQVFPFIVFNFTFNSNAEIMNNLSTVSPRSTTTSQNDDPTVRRRGPNSQNDGRPAVRPSVVRRCVSFVVVLWGACQNLPKLWKKIFFFNDKTLNLHLKVFSIFKLKLEPS